MDEGNWERLVTVMARLSAGDKAAVVTLYADFVSWVAGPVRRHLRKVGLDGVEREELHGVVFDACDEIGRCAGAWDPDRGVLPWTWADQRIAQVVRRWVGQHADPLADQADGAAPPASPGSEPEAYDLLTSTEHPMCRLLADGFRAAGVSERDQRLFLETRLQSSMGDPAPAATVAPLFDMQPAAVRQAVKRTKDRLLTLARTQPAYAPLADLALVS